MGEIENNAGQASSSSWFDSWFGDSDKLGANGLTQTTTDYSKSILALQEKHPGASQTELAAMLEASKPKDTFLGMGKGTLEGVTGFASTLATGFDIYDKLWGDTASLNKQRKDIYNQQIASNNAAAKAKANFVTNINASGLGKL